MNCRYLAPSTFDDEVFITVSVSEFRGVKLHLAYKMKDAQDHTICEAQSEHAFLNREGRPVRMKKEYPDLFAALSACVSN